MNELIELRDGWGQPEPPSQAARATARGALMRQVAGEGSPVPPRVSLTAAGHTRPGPQGRGPVWPRRRRTRWVVGGTALTAAAAVVAAVVAAMAWPATTGPGRHAGTQAVAITRLSGRQILLAAATKAAAAPAQTGAYWYVKQVVPNPDAPAGKSTVRNWYSRAGTEYDLSPDGTEIYNSGSTGFSVGGRLLTYGQIRRLPTGPAALKAWLAWALTHPSCRACSGGAPRARPAGGTPPSATPAGEAVALSELLYQVPAPPALRAAAFRALAAMPDVTRLGNSSSGVVLKISVPEPPASKFPAGKLPVGAGKITLTISTTTLSLRVWSDYQGTTTILKAGWTNARPRIVPIGKLFPAKKGTGAGQG